MIEASGFRTVPELMRLVLRSFLPPAAELEAKDRQDDFHTDGRER